MVDTATALPSSSLVPCSETTARDCVIDAGMVLISNRSYPDLSPKCFSVPDTIVIGYGDSIL